MAILLNGMNRREIARWTDAMIASGERMDFSGAVAPDRRQALDRRGRRQDHAAARTARRRLRRRRTPAVRAAASATPAARSTSSSRSRAGARRCRNEEMLAQLEDGRRGHLRGRRRARPGRQEALRPARRHRHRRGDPADRSVDHVARRSPRAPARSCSTSRSARGAFMKDLDTARELAETMVALGTDAGRAHRRAAHRHGHPAGPDRRQRDRGRRSRSRCSPAAGPPTWSS